MLARERVRLYRYETMAAYYRLLFQSARHRLLHKWLQKAEARLAMVEKRYESGDVARVVPQEAKRQIASRRRRVLEAEGAMSNAYGELAWRLGLTPEALRRYDLPALPEPQEPKLTREAALAQSAACRLDLKAIELKRRKLQLALNHAKHLLAPRGDVALTGVHDVTYGEGYKLSFGLDMPLQRRAYEGESQALRAQMASLAWAKKEL
ncbi:TolC family protein [Hydrogenimonas sp.]